MHCMKLTFAHKGVFKCGELHVGDMALFQDGALGKVRSFWQRGDQISIGIDRHRHMNALRWDLAPHGVFFVDAELLIEPMFWHAKANSILAAAPSYG